MLLDPDEAGLKIRKQLKNLLPNSVDIEIDITKCNRGIKNGVAECQIDEILSKLHKYVDDEVKSSSDITESDLYNLGLIGNNIYWIHFKALYTPNTIILKLSSIE